MTDQPLFHIVGRQQWTAALRCGELAPPSLQSEGFVHLSYAGQVTAVANRFYSDLDDLLVVQFDPSAVGKVLVEDSYGAGESFPHVYAPIATSAAVAEHPLDRLADGSWRFDADGAAVSGVDL